MTRNVLAESFDELILATSHAIVALDSDDVDVARLYLENALNRVEQLLDDGAAH
jgi:hypothetical protein